MLIKKFGCYSLVGIFNTVIHWSVFYLAILFGLTQALANTFGFVMAVSASYLLNAKFTFKQSVHKKSYVWFLLVMGLTSTSIGFLGDWLDWPGLMTLVLFSTISLILGFLFSNYWVFR